MTSLEHLTSEVEYLRQRMYQAYQNSVSYEELVIISQKLDAALNRLDKQID